MLNFFLQFWDAIVGVFALVAQLLKSLIQGFMFLPYFISSLSESIGYLPGILAVFASLGVTLLIINYIVGR